uniref:Uncharacterized protein n=1 Tax=uncultured marine virus TaxID=186617 RepID=A0A0F7L330_9VIRU|nr:hypothetical protein [uncultured marine virus]
MTKNFLLRSSRHYLFSHGFIPFLLLYSTFSLYLGFACFFILDNALNILSALT